MISIGSSTSTRLRMPWRNGIAVGRACDLLRADLLDHLAILQRDLGFRTCRFHAIFDDEMQVVVPRPGGGFACQWHQVDKIYDSLLRLGLKPFVELNPMPALLASGGQRMFHYQMNVTPPKDYAAWEDLIHQFASHLVDRYGLDEVSSWWFEVWNEPNLGGFWGGSKEDYFRLYDASARAVKRVSQRLRIGGPASSKANWIQDLIDHHVATGVPLDFLSTHLYPQDEYVQYPDREGSPHAPGLFFQETVQGVQDLVRASARPDLPIHWTEFNAMSCASTREVEWVNNPTNDSLHGAAFVARNLIALDQAADTLTWWVASDLFVEAGMPSSAYSMTYGLLTIQGIPKASLQAFRFLRRMTGDLLATEVHQMPPGAGLCAVAEGPVVRILLWNQRLLEDPAPAIWCEVLDVPVVGNDQVVVTATIGAGHGSAYETWLAIGRPHHLSPAEEALLRAHAEPAWTGNRVTAAQGRVHLPVVLQPGEVVLIEIRPTSPSALPRSADPAEVARWDAIMGAQSR